MEMTSQVEVWMKIGTANYLFNLLVSFTESYYSIEDYMDTPQLQGISAQHVVRSTLHITVIYSEIIERQTERHRGIFSGPCPSNEYIPAVCKPVTSLVRVGSVGWACALLPLCFTLTTFCPINRFHVVGKFLLVYDAAQLTSNDNVHAEYMYISVWIIWVFLIYMFRKVK